MRNRILVALLLAFSVLLSGCGNAHDRTDAAPVKIACVGDSTTYGHGIEDREENCYPARLQALLGEGYQVKNFGESGYAAQSHADYPYSSHKQYRKSLKFAPDVVVFMFGTNDSKPDNWQGAEVFREELLAILETYADAQIILCTPPAAFLPEGWTGDVTNFDVQPKIVAEIAGIVREVAAEEGYPLVDIHALTAANPQWLENDGVHPSLEGAAAMAQEVYHALTGQA